MDKYRFRALGIWNINETEISIMLKPNKIIAAKDKHYFAIMFFGEWGIICYYIYLLMETQFFTLFIKRKLFLVLPLYD